MSSISNKHFKHLINLIAYGEKRIKNKKATNVPPFAADFKSK
jgi:hypothetical protein